MTDPIHKNYCDCGNCHFLGNYFSGSIQYDLYYCENDGKGIPGFFARYGSEPSEIEGMPANVSMTPGYVKGADVDALRMARLRARLKGLLVKKAT